VPLGGGGGRGWGHRATHLGEPDRATLRGGFSTAQGRGSAERAIHHLNQPHYRRRGGGQPLTWRQQRPRKRPTAAQGASRASAGSYGEGLGGTAQGGPGPPSPPPPPSHTKRNRGETPPVLSLDTLPWMPGRPPPPAMGAAPAVRPSRARRRLSHMCTCYWIPAIGYLVVDWVLATKKKNAQK